MLPPQIFSQSHSISLLMGVGASLFFKLRGVCRAGSSPLLLQLVQALMEH
jgi:hypothetical protein